MRIAIITTNNPSMYSGGRYHSLGIALSLSLNNRNEVYYITNNKPIFYDDFQEQNNKLNLCLTHDFVFNMPNGDFDIIFLVPHQQDNDFYPKVKLFTLERNAKLVLVNFESGNWFNEFSSRDLNLWNPWKKACEIGCLILSISQEGNKYAQKFYLDHSSLISFDYWYPQINNVEANKNKDIKRIDKRILILGRLSDSHKGGDDILSLFDKSLSGTTFVFLVGSSTLDNEFVNKMNSLSKKYNINTEFLFQLNDQDKFKEYKKASVLVFPSYFEGYGYPPVEAMYCNTPVIAYDLPVLREVTNNGAIFVERGNKEKLKDTLSNFIQGKINYKTDLKSLVSDNTNFEMNANRLENILKDYISNVKGLTKKKKKLLQKQLKKEIKEKNTSLEFKERKNIKYYLKKIYRKFKPIPDLFKVNVKQDGNLYNIKGYLLTSKNFKNIEVIVNNINVCSTDTLIKRPDIIKQNSNYKNLHCGFEFSFNLDKEGIIYQNYQFSNGELKIEFI